jgi:hypothetical protein
MKKDPSKRVPGSRKYREAMNDRRIFKVRNPDGSPIGFGIEEVGVDYICRNGGGVLGQFRMLTGPNSDRTVQLIALPNGERPDQADRHGDEAKALMFCDRCGTEIRISFATMTARLNKLWAPNARRVESEIVCALDLK